MKRLALILPLLALAVSGCRTADKSLLAEPWTRLEIHRRDTFVNPTLDPNRIVYLTEAARTRKEPLPTIIINNPAVLRELRESFPFQKMEPSFKPGALLNFECSATTESGGTLLLYYFDHRANHGKAHGLISVAFPGGDYHHEGPAADRFFERLWAVCRRDGLFEGSFSDFIVTSDELKRIIPDRLNPRDARLQQEWASLVETPTKHPATPSPAEETHAESAEDAGPEPYAEPAEGAE